MEANVTQPIIYGCAQCKNRLFNDERACVLDGYIMVFDKPTTPDTVHLTVKKINGVFETQVFCNNCMNFLGVVKITDKQPLKNNEESTGIYFCVNKDVIVVL